MKQVKGAIAVHGGASGSKTNEDGCELAAKLGAEVLAGGGRAVDAAVRAVIHLEDDGRYNAGYGSVMCLDGVTVEMDAAVMESTGMLGAVACLRSIRNPVLAALAVAKTPHWLLAGEGAERFARAHGLEIRHESSAQAIKKHGELIAALNSGSPECATSSLRRDWNYPMPWDAAVKSFGSGTVGAVAVDTHGCYAVATSTGGSAPSLLGRVGDTPIIGCGFFAGPMGAIAVTGVGEYIVPRLLARSIYSAAESHSSLEQAIDIAISSFPSEIDLGIIGISATAIVMKSNRNMPCAVARQ